MTVSPRPRERVPARPISLATAPVVDLSLDATEDRVVGVVDLERALSQGIKAF